MINFFHGIESSMLGSSPLLMVTVVRYILLIITGITILLTLVEMMPRHGKNRKRVKYPVDTDRIKR
jgi:hypothetical protein